MKNLARVYVQEPCECGDGSRDPWPRDVLYFMDVENPVYWMLRKLVATYDRIPETERMSRPDMDGYLLPVYRSCRIDAWDDDEHPYRDLEDESDEDIVAAAVHLLLSNVIENSMVAAEGLPSGVPFCIADLPAIHLTTCHDQSNAVLVTHEIGLASNPRYMRLLLDAEVTRSCCLRRYWECFRFVDECSRIIRRTWAALVIQSVFRASISNPATKICRSRARV